MSTMRKRIAEAGLKPDSASQLQAALQRLAADGQRAVVVRWDGTRCDLLIADVDDGYGLHASQAALRRGGRVLALSTVQPDVAGAAATLSTHVDAATLASVLQRLFAEAPSAAPAPPQPAPHAGHAGNLLESLRLNGNARLDDIVARRGPLEILIRRSASRILATSQRDLLATRSAMLDDAWSLAPASAADGNDARFATASSLDVFLLGACLSMEARLPQMPAQVYRLPLWPDMGKLGDHVDALRIVAALVREPLSAAQLELRTGASARRVNAVLWATHAAGLLETLDQACELVEPAPAAAARSRFGQAFGKLLRRFGLD